MMNEIELSIVVPVYNCEKSVCRCIDSILNSEYKSYEIIIINDGSSDNTVYIIKNEYSSKDNIRFINLEKNQGVSYCRNIGIEESNGNYITFVDADDYISTNIYSEMMKIIREEDVDCCGCDYCEIFPDGSIQKSKYNYKNNILNNEKCIKAFLVDNISPAAWDKIFKAELVKKYVRFDRKLKVGEDILFCLNFFYRAERIYLLNQIHYYYEQQENSVMHEMSPKLLQFTEITKQINKEQLDIYEKNFKEEYQYFVSAMLIRGIHTITFLINKENIKQAKVYLKVLKQVNLLKIQMRSKYTKKFIKFEMFNFIYLGINIHILLSPIYIKARKFLRKIR